jgi:hypothetical protein
MIPCLSYLYNSQSDSMSDDDSDSTWHPEEGDDSESEFSDEDYMSDDEPACEEMTDEPAGESLPFKIEWEIESKEDKI